MAAVAFPRVAVPAPRPRARLASGPGPRETTNPTGTRSPGRPTAATYRRRRLGVLAGAVALAPAAHLCAALLGGGPLTAPGEPTRAVAAHVYVVQPGDTLWSIAEQVEPGRDPRPLVQTLANQLGGSGLQPGQALQLP